MNCSSCKFLGYSNALECNSCYSYCNWAAKTNISESDLPVIFTQEEINILKQIVKEYKNNLGK
jgi:hypothetical protein